MIARILRILRRLLAPKRNASGQFISNRSKAIDRALLMRDQINERRARNNLPPIQWKHQL